MTFGNNLGNFTQWYAVLAPTNQHNLLKVDFDEPAKYIAIDMIGESDGSGVLSLWFTGGGYYNFTVPLIAGQAFHVEFNSAYLAIDWVAIGGNIPVHLDNLFALVTNRGMVAT